MLASESLKDLLHQPDLARQDALLLCLAVEAGRPKEVKEVKALATRAGLRAAGKWNISDILGRAKGLAVHTGVGWELTSKGCERVTRLAGALVGGPAAQVASSLRAQLASMSDPQVIAFVEEAIRCLESKLYRAAVVLSWVGAASVLQGHVISNSLGAFNAEAARRDSRWRPAKTKDDLSRMKEHDFLQVLEAVSVLGKSVKQELEGCLKLRNGCGHPNSLKISESRASAHIEVLMLNVFAVFTA